MVMEGESFTRQGDGKWIKLELALDDTDLAAILLEWGVSRPINIPVSLRYEILTTQAQRLIAVRSFQAGGVTREELQVTFTRLRPSIDKQKATVLDLQEKTSAS